MTDRFTSNELVTKAVDMLTQQYDSDNDSFFVVVTKGGKEAGAVNPPQFIVGELDLKSVVAFVIQGIAYLCNSMGMNPFVFISRFIVGYFIDEERRSLAQTFIQEHGIELDDEDLDDEDFEDDEDENEQIEVIEQEGQGDQLLKALVQALSGKKVQRPVFYVTNYRMIDSDN